MILSPLRKATAEATILKNGIRRAEIGTFCGKTSAATRPKKTKTARRFLEGLEFYIYAYA